MKLFRGLIAIAVSGSIILASCQKAETLPSGCVDNGAMSFLKVGNELVYDYTDIATLDDELIITVSGKTEDGAYILDLTEGGAYVETTGDTRYMRECDEWLLIDAEQDPTSSDRGFPVNRTIDQTWMEGQAGQYKVIEKNVAVSVQAGTFTCDVIRFEPTNTFDTITIYFNNQVGYVKYDGLQTQYELKSKNF